MLISCTAINNPINSHARVSENAESGYRLMVYQKKPDKNIYLASLLSQSCWPSYPYYSWEIQLDLSLGKKTVLVHHAKNSTLQNTMVEIGSENFFIAHTPDDLNKTSAQLCRLWKAQSHNTYVAKKDESSVIASSLNFWGQEIQPNCLQAEQRENSRLCREIHSLTEIHKKINRLDQKALRKWKRHPYLFSRRLNLTRNLIHLAQAKDIKKELHSFCKILHISDSWELTVAMRSKNWQEKICQVPHSKNILSQLLLAINYSYKEILTSYQLITRTTRTGLISLRIPRKKLKDSRIKLTLLPASDVSENIKKELIDIVFQGKKSTSASLACWNDYFHKKHKLLHVANLIQILPAKTRHNCFYREKENDSKEALAYFTDTIMGETQFVISNGYKKVLKLPKGHYKYSIEESTRKIVTSKKQGKKLNTLESSFAWTRKKPRAIIRKL